MKANRLTLKKLISRSGNISLSVYVTGGVYYIEFENKDKLFLTTKQF